MVAGFFLLHFLQVDKQNEGNAIIDIEKRGGNNMAAKQQRKPEITCFYREDGEELQKILKQSFRKVILNQLKERQIGGER